MSSSYRQFQIACSKKVGRKVFRSILPFSATMKVTAIAAILLLMALSSTRAMFSIRSHSVAATIGILPMATAAVKGHLRPPPSERLPSEESSGVVLVTRGRSSGNSDNGKKLKECIKACREGNEGSALKGCKKDCHERFKDGFPTTTTTTTTTITTTTTRRSGILSDLTACNSQWESFISPGSFSGVVFCSEDGNDTLLEISGNSQFPYIVCVPCAFWCTSTNTDDATECCKAACEVSCGCSSYPTNPTSESTTTER